MAVFVLVVVYVFKEECDGGIGVVNADEGGVYRLLGYEILVDDYGRRLGLIYVMLVFGIGVEAEISGLAVLDLGESSGSGRIIAVDGSFEDNG